MEPFINCYIATGFSSFDDKWGNLCVYVHGFYSTSDEAYKHGMPVGPLNEEEIKLLRQDDSGNWFMILHALKDRLKF